MVANRGGAIRVEVNLVLPEADLCHQEVAQKQTQQHKFQHSGPLANTATQTSLERCSFQAAEFIGCQMVEAKSSLQSQGQVFPDQGTAESIWLICCHKSKQ